jgi:hypothetical protein
VGGPTEAFLLGCQIVPWCGLPFLLLVSGSGPNRWPDGSYEASGLGKWLLTVFIPPTPGCSSDAPARLLIPPGWFAPPVGARSALRLSLSYCACESAAGASSFVITAHFRQSMVFKPSVSDTPCPFPLTSPGGPDFSVSLGPDRVRCLYIKG